MRERQATTVFAPTCIKKVESFLFLSILDCPPYNRVLKDTMMWKKCNMTIQIFSNLVYRQKVHIWFGNMQKNSEVESLLVSRKQATIVIVPTCIKKVESFLFLSILDCPPYDWVLKDTMMWKKCHMTIQIFSNLCIGKKFTYGLGTCKKILK